MPIHIRKHNFISNQNNWIWMGKVLANPFNLFSTITILCYVVDNKDIKAK